MATRFHTGAETLDDYFKQVIEILESFDYPSLIYGFAPEQVARSLGNTITDDFILGISPRACAIIIWSMTMNYQILSRSKQ